MEWSAIVECANEKKSETELYPLRKERLLSGVGRIGEVRTVYIREWSKHV
jgi:hypothetical protein